MPRCSQCEIYSCQCTHQAVSRRKKARKYPLEQPSHLRATNSNERIETLRQDEPKKSTGDKDQYKSTSSAHKGEQELAGEIDLQLPTSNGGSSLDILLGIADTGLLWDADLTETDTLLSLQMSLPPESIVRQIIDTYLVNFNTVFPLFDPQHLTKTVDQWFNSPTQRSRTSWAIINVVMAIAQYCVIGEPDHSNANFSFDSSVSDCLGKAQSALTELLMGEIELANLQVVLGLVIVFHATSDVKPAVFLMSTAIRLSQVLGLHRSDSYIYRDSSRRDVLQYQRVFWITYILDRSIALRIRQAPIQQDKEISIDLPPLGSDEDAAGFVGTPETYEHGFNFFRAHVELSQIQGYVYDAIFSVRASQLSPGERAANSQAIRSLLKDWKDRVPATLTAKSLSLAQTYLPCVTNLLCMLHGIVVTCLGLLCRVNAMDFHWIDQLRDYGRSVTAGIGEPCVPPPQPQGWNALVNECREFMPLFNSVQEKGPAFIW